MKLTTPRWWYTRDDRRYMAMIRGLMTPLSWIWAAETARRMGKTPPDSGVPTICVGNLTIGGSGKTPVVRAIAKRLESLGTGVAVLSRGYGGRLSGPIRVHAASHTAGDVGDEPLMLARDLTAWISRDRFAGAQAAAAAGAEVVVLDDGHQNASLRKALSIVVVDGETRDGEWPFGDGRVFPAGPMREPLEAGLARADAVVVLLPPGVDDADPELLALLAPTPVLIAWLRAVTAPPTGPQVGFAGIAKPWKVERSLIAAGCDLKEFAPFPDHYAYDETALKMLADRADQFGAGLLTTEKDWARLPPEWRSRITAWPVEAVFDEAELDALLAKLS